MGKLNIIFKLQFNYLFSLFSRLVMNWSE